MWQSRRLLCMSCSWGWCICRCTTIPKMISWYTALGHDDIVFHTLSAIYWNANDPICSSGIHSCAVSGSIMCQTPVAKAKSKLAVISYDLNFCNQLTYCYRIQIRKLYLCPPVPWHCRRFNRDNLHVQTAAAPSMVLVDSRRISKRSVPLYYQSWFLSLVRKGEMISASGAWIRQCGDVETAEGHLRARRIYFTTGCS